MRYIIVLTLILFVSCDKPEGLKFSNNPVEIQPACRMDLGRKAYTAYWDKFDELLQARNEYILIAVNYYHMSAEKQMKALEKQRLKMRRIGDECDVCLKNKLAIDSYNIQYCD